MNSLPPLILREIFEHLLHDFPIGRRTLRSLLRINRNWRDIAIPVFWQRPFDRSSDCSIVNILILHLNEEERKSISLLLPPKLDSKISYARHLRELDFNTLCRSIDLWLVKTKHIWRRRLSCEEADGRVVSFQSLLEVKQQIVYSFLKMFARHGVRLRMLLCDFRGGGLTEDDVQLMFKPDVQTLASTICEVRIAGSANMEKLFDGLTNTARDLELIQIFISSYNESNGISRQADSLSAFIRAQHGLISLKLALQLSASDITCILESIESQHDTLRHLYIASVNFFGVVPLGMITKCYQLRTITFSDCKSLTTNITEPLISTIFPHLKNVNLRTSSCRELRDWANVVNSES